jgi:purine-binding chemotaxis protein CheW
VPKPGRIAAAPSMMQLAVFPVGGSEYAVDIMRITEIIRPLKVTVIPRAPSFVEGVINLRGRIVPVVDMRKRFGLAEGVPFGRKARVVIVRAAGRLIGALVDEVREVLSVPVDQVEETPEAARGIDAQFVRGVAKQGERLIVVLDIEKLLTSEEIKELNDAGDLEAEVPEGGEG